MRNLTSFLAVILFTLVISGCSSLGRLHAVPESMQDTAKIPGFSGIRYRLDSKEDSEAFAQEAINAGLKEFAYLGYQGIPKNPPPTHYLAVSTLDKCKNVYYIFQLSLIASSINAHDQQKRVCFCYAMIYTYLPAIQPASQPASTLLVHEM